MTDTKPLWCDPHGIEYTNGWRARVQQDRLDQGRPKHWRIGWHDADMAIQAGRVQEDKW